MSYKYRCSGCGATFTRNTKQDRPVNPYCSCSTSTQSTLLEDLGELAVGVAVGYVTGSLAESAVDAALDVAGALFDW